MLIAILYYLSRIAGIPASKRLTHQFMPLNRVYVHPCVINNRPHIVYPQGLPTQAPQLFQTLCHYYSRQGYALKEDQRQTDVGNLPDHERRLWAPILLFTTGLIFEGAAFAEAENHAPDSVASSSQQVELRLVSTDPVKPATDDLQASSPRQDNRALVNSEIATRIYGMFLQHYKRQENDPDYVLDDFKEIANYYSRFVEVVNLLDGLNEKRWQLSYDEHSWVTVASGNAFRVDHAVVHFNTRSAAQLKMYNRCQENPVCIASPADALLHELLHAYSMLVRTDEFIAQGGMNAVLYPYKHEYAIIDAERKLYASMSQRDDIKRPQRVDHTGRLVKAQCPTCIK
jgi:hypothetical protein